MHAWDLPGRITYDDVIDWVAEADVLPTQTDLETPSVSVVVRTHRDVETSVQHKYFRPHLALDPSFTNAETTRRLQILDLLDRLNSPRYEDVACRMLERADCLETFELLNMCRPQREKAPAVFERLIKMARARHGSRLDLMLPVFDEMDREAVLITRREKIVDRDHRFLLALLINLPNHESILSMIRERHFGAREQLVMT